MRKEDLLKVLGFKSCYICGVVFSEGKELRCFDHDYEARNGSLKETVYDFCTTHAPTFGSTLAIGGFGKFYKDGLKVFIWIMGGTETPASWHEIDKTKIRDWLDKVYAD